MIRGSLRAAIFTAIVTGAIGFLPLFGGVGYEYSFACGLVLPSAVAIDRALALSAARAPRPGAAVRSGVGSGLIVALVAVVIGLLHGLRVGTCDLWGGLAYFGLTAGFGAALAGLWGVVVGEVARGRRFRKTVAVLLAFAGPLASALISVGRFATSPMIYAYDPFVGYFSGTLYDTVVEPGPALLWYRLGTTATLVFGFAFASLLRRSGGRLRKVPVLAPRHRLRALLAAVALVGTVTLTASGVRLGHWSTAASIAKDLGARKDGARCTVIYPTSLRDDEAALVLKDCEEELAEVEAHFGVRGPERLTAFFFRDSADKKRLMGAADTYIAKPWRYEVYLQYAPFPHPVLKHELAHVVAAEMAPGPLHITAQASFIPVPGLIEGAAVAGAWEGESDVTPHQWSRTMLEAGLAPRVRTLTGLGFFTSASLTAYTAAGSFCRWLHDTRGAERFRTLYATGDFEASYGTSVVALEREWHTFLRTVAVPERTLARARTRFRRASIFGRQCPFELEALATDAHRHLAAGEVRRAEEEYATLVSRDPTDARTRMQLAVARVRAGDVPGALRVADEAERALGVAAGNRVRMAAADATWRWRGGGEALAIYGRLDEGLFEEDEARTLAIKLRVLREGGERAEALRDLLIGRGELDASPTVAAVRLSALHARTRDPMASYLVGRQLFAYERFEEMLAAVDLDGVASLGDARVLAEARRMVATARYRAGDLVGARVMFEAIGADETRPMGVRETARDWVDRIEREAAR